MTSSAARDGAAAPAQNAKSQGEERIVEILAIGMRRARGQRRRRRVITAVKVMAFAAVVGGAFAAGLSVAETDR